MTRGQAARLKKHLPSGWLVKVRRKLTEAGKGYTDAYISNVAAGRKQNADIEEALFRVAEEEKARLREVDARINALAAAC